MTRNSKRQSSTTTQTNPFLNELVLLKNDPELAEELRKEALKGTTDAQYALGLVYAEGRGVKPDLAKAYAWLTLAIMHGDDDAEQLRYIVGERMTDEDYEHGQLRAAEYEQLLANNTELPVTLKN